MTPAQKRLVNIIRQYGDAECEWFDAELAALLAEHEETP